MQDSASQSSHLQILQVVIDWLSSCEKVWLCTVLETWGSSPRPKGSLFAVTERGQTVGSLSGGCVEEDLVERLLENPLSLENTVQVYGGDRQQGDRFRLPCGGQLVILIEALTDNSLSNYRDILQSVQTYRPIIKVVRDIEADQMFVELQSLAELPEHQREILPKNSVIFGERQLIQYFGPLHELLIIGATDVSRAVATIGLMLGYKVTVCDPREELAVGWPMQGVTLVRAMPDDVIRQHENLLNTAILALTHDPRVDDMGLMEALTTEAFYIGALGSRRTSEKRRDRLLQLGLSQVDIDKLHAPIGIAIGSKTPAEIAVSILADITAVKNAVVNSTRLPAHS